MSEQVFKVKCTQCAVVMKFFPRAAESQLTCPKCGQRMRVKTPLAAVVSSAPAGSTRSAATARPVATPTAAMKSAGSRPVTARTTGPAVKRSATSAAATKRPARVASAAAGPADWTDFPSAVGGTPMMSTGLAPLPGGPSVKKAGWFSKLKKRPAPSASFATVSTPRAAYVTPTSAQRPATGGNQLLKKVLLGVAGLIGGLVGILVLLIAVGLVVSAMMGRAQSKTTITMMGWSVDAPGRVVPGPGGERPDNRNIFHRSTNSEFSLSSKRVAGPGQSFTIEQIVAGMQLKTSLRDVQAVERSGLSGYRFSMLIPESGMRSQMEIFKIDESHVLLLAYVSGQERERANFGKARHNEEKTRELDDPEAFFASLHRN